jgi:IS30 family transposase
MKYTHLSQTERYQISTMLRLNCRIAQIAQLPLKSEVQHTEQKASKEHKWKQRNTTNNLTTKTALP